MLGPFRNQIIPPHMRRVLCVTHIRRFIDALIQGALVQDRNQFGISPGRQLAQGSYLKSLHLHVRPSPADLQQGQHWQGLLGMTSCCVSPLTVKVSLLLSFCRHALATLQVKVQMTWTRSERFQGNGVIVLRSGRLQSRRHKGGATWLCQNEQCLGVANWLVGEGKRVPVVLCLGIGKITEIALVLWSLTLKVTVSLGCDVSKAQQKSDSQPTAGAHYTQPRLPNKTDVAQW